LYAPYLKSYSNSEASEQVNNIYLDPTTAPPTAISLSSGEMRVLKSMMDGISNQAIADREEWAVNTVRARVSSIMRKLRVQSRTEAIEKARRLGITA
jgi:DNA-binding NarL/FixJ family response regulator